MTEVLGEVIGVSRHTSLVPPSSIQRFPSNSCGRLVLHTKFNICENVANALSKSILLLRVELTLRPSHFHTACRVSFARLQQRRFPKDCETQLNNADLDGISRCSRVVILEPPDSQYCYFHTVIRTQLGESWLLGMLPVRDEVSAEHSRILHDCRSSC